eukprot:641663-Rhodomonas_salina.1
MVERVLLSAARANEETASLVSKQKEREGSNVGAGRGKAVGRGEEKRIRGLKARRKIDLKNCICGASLSIGMGPGATSERTSPPAQKAFSPAPCSSTIPIICASSMSL